MQSLATSLPLLCLSLALVSGPARADEEAAAAGVQAGVDASPQSDPAASVDPWEPVNRKVFAFNEALDRWLLEPVATGWDWIMPDPVQNCVGNFFENTTLPVRAANDLLQGKPWRAYETAWRLVINSTVGIGGLFDPASHWQVHKSDEDFGQTLGYWGVPSGPYWVLPFLGPSSPRDATGLAVDASAYFFVVIPIYIGGPAFVTDIVNDRADLLEEIAAERESAFDFYTFVRSSYTQFRENRIRDRADEDDEEGDEDLYYFDEEDDGA